MCQAELVFLAATGLEGRPPKTSHVVNYVVNTLGIGDYSSHKYLPNTIHDKINKLPGIDEGAGCY